MTEKIAVGPLSFMSVMPALLVGVNIKGKPNYMTAGAATGASKVPPRVCVAIEKTRYTSIGIEENKTFSLNVPSSLQVVATDYCGLSSGANVDKSKVFHSFYGQLETAPMAEECPVNIECKLFQSVDCGSHVLHIGDVKEIYTDGSCITGGKPDIETIRPIVYSDSRYWKCGNEIGRAFLVGIKYKNG